MHKVLSVVISTIIISGCTMTIPVAVIGQRGEILRGENKVSLTEGSFR
jgi:hypothetical protein